LPQFPQFPGMPQIPQMPQMRRDAQEMLERFRRSMDAYLNPTGEIPSEDVPFIDLGEDDDRREMTEATDGTQVKGPYLPQYVFERFTQSLARFRNDLNPGMEEIPEFDLDQQQDQDEDLRERHLWDQDGAPVSRVVTMHEEDEDDEEDDSSSDESVHEEEEDDDDDDEEVDVHGKMWDLPGHR
jgi:hypothetical protein